MKKLHTGTQKLRCAVIGVGYMGRFHAEKFAASEAAELVAVIDADASRATHGTDYKPWLGRIDAAVVAVPTQQHFGVVKDCLEAGVHVLVEKPIATTLEEADGLLELAARKSLVLQVGHLQRFNPAFQALVAQGGRPLFIDIERLAPFKARGADVDVVLDLMIHDLDLVLALAKAPIEQVSASVSASRVSQSPVRKLRVFRHDAYVSADLQEQRLRHVRKANDGIAESEQTFERADELR